MPLGSSSAAPVMRPGPSRLARTLIWSLTLLKRTFISHLPVQTQAVERGRAAIAVVAGGGDALGVGGQRAAGTEIEGVVALGQALVAVTQCAVAEEGREAAAGQDLAMRRGDRVLAEREA